MLTVYIPKVYCILTVYVPELYRTLTVYIPEVYRIRTRFAPHTNRVHTRSVPYTNHTNTGCAPYTYWSAPYTFTHGCTSVVLGDKQSIRARGLKLGSCFRSSTQQPACLESRNSALRKKLHKALATSQQRWWNNYAHLSAAHENRTSGTFKTSDPRSREEPLLPTTQQMCQRDDFQVRAQYVFCNTFFTGLDMHILASWKHTAPLKYYCSTTEILLKVLGFSDVINEKKERIILKWFAEVLPQVLSQSIWKRTVQYFAPLHI